MDEQKLRENLDVMDSLIAELRQDDSKGITDVQRAYSELLQLLAEGESQVMHLIQGLSTNVNELQRQAIPSEPPGAHTQRIGALEGQKQDAQTNVNHLSTQLDTLTSRRKDMAQKFQDLREQRARIDQLAMQQEPEITNKLSFEDVQGPQTFELELSTLSQCQIADKLWGLMEC